MKNVIKNKIRKKRSNQAEIKLNKKYKKMPIAKVEKKAMRSEVEAAKLYFLENFIFFKPQIYSQHPLRS
jgi:hypothetical protein